MLQLLQLKTNSLIIVVFLIVIRLSKNKNI
uniref:Uncharacterized protein n=1 Tax=Siphoviridae sp. ctsoB6 TaxID=2826487 RepID=A0A8S5QPS0_9CAUD|nr:MAG TPA: hypothetical protein [Siphoviridae sp. ctsoB6]